MVGITKELNQKLNVALNNCIRFIFKIPRWLHISPYRVQLNWLKVDYRREYFLGCILFKILHLGVPTSLTSFFNKNTKQTVNIIDPLNNNVDPLLIELSNVRSTRSVPQPLNVPHSRTVTSFTSFPNAAASFWNEIPTDITSLQNFNVFKNKLMDLLLHRQNILNLR